MASKGRVCAKRLQLGLDYYKDREYGVPVSSREATPPKIFTEQEVLVYVRRLKLSSNVESEEFKVIIVLVEQYLAKFCR